MPVPTDIADAIGRIALRDRAAFDWLYERTSAKLFGVLLRILKDRGEAEDALQEVYVRIWQKADRFAATGASPMSWLIAIARNHAVDRLRKRAPATAPIEAAAEVRDAAPDPEARAIGSGQKTRIDTCLDRLETDKAEAVRAAYLEGYEYKELAERFAVPLNTMRTWLRRSLQKLKACLEE